VLVDDLRLVATLRRGDEAAFGLLLDRYHSAMVCLAMAYVPNRAVAEEVVQETWEALLKGIHRFDGRSTLKTWIFSILTNCAKTRGARESRSMPFSTLLQPDDAYDEALWHRLGPADEPAVSPSRFDAESHHWISVSTPWHVTPEDRLLSQEMHACIRDAIAALPASQRVVITLRDVKGWTATEVCTAVNLSEVNQRVLLHRARSKVRRALEEYFGAVEDQ